MMINGAAPRSAQAAARALQSVPGSRLPKHGPALAAPNSLICASKRKSSPNLIADHKADLARRLRPAIITQRDRRSRL